MANFQVPPKQSTMHIVGQPRRVVESACRRGQGHGTTHFGLGERLAGMDSCRSLRHGRPGARAPETAAVVSGVHLEVEPPADCPFEHSRELTGIEFLGVHSDYRFADTWYPTWAADGNLYSPWTDGDVHGEASSSDGVIEEKINDTRWLKPVPGKATTGQAVLIGDDPLNLTVKSLGKVAADPFPYAGRYPCGSLAYRDAWFYGTYCLAPSGMMKFGDTVYNWPWLGPLVGFRVSTDHGRTWTETPHTPEQPLFGETGMWGHPVKIGAPHFVDFGKDMEHSPDGKAYLLAQGAELTDPKPRIANLSWITADQVYMLRVKPRIDHINDAAKYEFFGHGSRRQPFWTHELNRSSLCSSGTTTWAA